MFPLLHSGRQDQQGEHSHLHNSANEFLGNTHHKTVPAKVYCGQLTRYISQRLIIHITIVKAMRNPTAKKLISPFKKNLIQLFPNSFDHETFPFFSSCDIYQQSMLWKSLAWSPLPEVIAWFAWVPLRFP